MLVFTHSFLIALVLTVVVETIILFFLIRKIFKINFKRINNKILLFAGICASVLTIPYVWYVVPVLIWWSVPLAIFTAEIFVLVFEALFYKVFLNLDYKKSFLISFVCNLASYLIGLILLKQIYETLF